MSGSRQRAVGSKKEPLNHEKNRHPFKEELPGHTKFNVQFRKSVKGKMMINYGFLVNLVEFGFGFVNLIR